MKRVTIIFRSIFWLAVAVLLIVLCTQDTITRACLEEFADNFLRNPLERLHVLLSVYPDSLDEWMDSIRGICILLLILAFQWWLLGRRWWIVRYLPLLVYTASWLFGEYAYLTDGGWGGLIVGYMMTGFGMIGVCLTGIVCIAWHIRKHFRKTA